MKYTMSVVTRPAYRPVTLPGTCQSEVLTCLSNHGEHVLEALTLLKTCLAVRCDARAAGDRTTFWAASTEHEHSTEAVLSAPCMNMGPVYSPSSRGRLLRRSDLRAQPQCLHGQQKREVRPQTVDDKRPTYAGTWTSGPVVRAVSHLWR